jgi:hypothetical protein
VLGRLKRQSLAPCPPECRGSLFLLSACFFSALFSVEALNRAWKDDIVKEAFLKAFTAKHITFSIVPADFVVDKAALAVWNGYNGLRMEEGRLDIFIKKSTFWTNTNQLEQIKVRENRATVLSGRREQREERARPLVGAV